VITPPITAPPERRTEVRPFSGADRDRHHAGDQRKGRHEDRPQPHAARFDEGLAPRLAAAEACADLEGDASMSGISAGR